MARSWSNHVRSCKLTCVCNNVVKELSQWLVKATHMYTYSMEHATFILLYNFVQTREKDSQIQHYPSSVAYAASKNMFVHSRCTPSTISSIGFFLYCLRVLKCKVNYRLIIYTFIRNETMMYWQGFKQRLIAAVDIIRESAVESVLNRILYQCVMPDGSMTDILFYDFFYKQTFFLWTLNATLLRIHCIGACIN